MVPARGGGPRSLLDVVGLETKVAADPVVGDRVAMHSGRCRQVFLGSRSATSPFRPQLLGFESSQSLASLAMSIAKDIDLGLDTIESGLEP